MGFGESQNSAHKVTEDEQFLYLKLVYSNPVLVARCQWFKSPTYPRSRESCFQKSFRTGIGRQTFLPSASCPKVVGKVEYVFVAMIS